MIISGGFNIFPSQVEDAVRTMPGVEDVAVVGMPESQRGEEVVAALILEAGATVTLEDVRRWAEKSIAHYALPRRIVVMRELPRSQIGKVMRRKVREYLEDAGERLEKSGQELREQIREGRERVGEQWREGLEQTSEELREFSERFEMRAQSLRSACVASMIAAIAPSLSRLMKAQIAKTTWINLRVEPRSDRYKVRLNTLLPGFRLVPGQYLVLFS